MRVGESERLQIRADIYNVLNHSKLSMVGEGPYYLNRVSGNRVVSGVMVRHGSNPRQIMLGVKRSDRIG
jgi:hypothetical protein